MKRYVFYITYIPHTSHIPFPCLLRVLAGAMCSLYYNFANLSMALIAYFLNSNWKLLQVVLMQGVHARKIVCFFYLYFAFPPCLAGIGRRQKGGHPTHLLQMITNKDFNILDYKAQI